MALAGERLASGKHWMSFLFSPYLGFLSFPKPISNITKSIKIKETWQKERVSCKNKKQQLNSEERLQNTHLSPLEKLLPVKNVDVGQFSKTLELFKFFFFVWNLCKGAAVLLCTEVRERLRSQLKQSKTKSKDWRLLWWDANSGLAQLRPHLFALEPRCSFVQCERYS